MTGEDGKSLKKSILFASAVVAWVAIMLSVFYYLSEKQALVYHIPSHSQLTYWPVCLEESNDELENIKRVFDRLDYRKVNGSNETWDVLWSVEFPFDRFPEMLKGLKEHQSVNHFPGITFLTNKMYLSVHPGKGAHTKYIPIAFEFPKLKNEFLYYLKSFPSKRFVVKNFDNRGIKIVKPNEMDFFMGSLRFIQEFVENPMLIDGKAFDLGVYVLITSVNPLRIYRYKRLIRLRFCPDPFHPFDPENVDKYVVSETHLNSWEMPSLRTSIESFGFSPLESFQQYLLTNGHDVEKLWVQVDDAISQITLAKVTPISRYLELFEMSTLGRKRKLFELLRFDFLIDDEMNLHLMDINMSPNLTPVEKNQEKLRVPFEQLVYNTLLVVGATQRSELKPNSVEELLMLSSPKDIATSIEDCEKSENTCGDLNLCLRCLSNEDAQNIHQAYREHQRRGEMRRIFPTGIHFNQELALSNSTKLLAKWFKLKCENDHDWC